VNIKLHAKRKERDQEEVRVLVFLFSPIMLIRSDKRLTNDDNCGGDYHICMLLMRHYMQAS
jgi:hypothetical protein